ncbi:Peptidase family S41 [Marivirga sericea]|uniref:Peptidase family S41 n=1 Tax=Marivirga sericea TaxID=1028 RepID=A0A1X7K7I6_9BACT|nr:S41 family peptidase [Marivirga sericea]SMG36258.1 Peptidase family S41 [Marivirga sericea]
MKNSLVLSIITEEMPYQRYRFVGDEKDTGIKQIWEELVIPRGDAYDKPLIVLVGRWTGSMGEGISIGFDSFDRAEIVGTKMAGLLGGIWAFELDETKIGYQFPGIKLYHVDKTPREDFVPKNRIISNSDYLPKAKELIYKSVQ